jgi:hypothetical protein
MTLTESLIIVLAFIGSLCLLLAPLAYLADRVPRLARRWRK